MRTRRLLAALLAMIMVFSMSPAMLIVSTAADAGVDYQHVTVRTEGITPYPQQMTAGTVLDVVGGSNPIDAGAENNVRPTDKGVGGSAHGSYGAAWTNGGAGSVAMRSANTWLYGYVIKVEGLSSAAQANVYAQGWGHNGPTGAGTTGGGWNMEYKDAKYNIPGDGVYAILINGQAFGGSMNADRVAVAFVQKMQLSLNKDATVTFLGEIEAAVEDLTADNFANTLPINYMVDGELVTEEYPITSGLSKGQYITSQDAVAIPALDKKLDAVVDDSTKSTHIGWASTENAADADVAYAITEKGILDAIYPVYFTVPKIDAPAQQDGYHVVTHEPVVLNTNPTTQQTMWSGSVSLGSDGNVVAGVTLVYKIDGVETPIIGNDFNFKYNNSTWFSSRWFYTADGSYSWGGAPSAALVTYEKSGYYFTYIQGRVLDINSGAGITSVDGIELFKNATSNTDKHPRSVNTNSNATFELKAVVENNLAPTVNFYNGETLVATKTYQYTNGYTTLDWWGDGTRTSKQGKTLSADEFFELTGATAPTKEFDGTYNYRLVWVDENKQPVDGIYTSMNVYAYFEPVAANQVTVTFVDASDKIISSSYVEKGSTAEFTGTNPSKATTATTEYVFAGWAIEKDGEVVELATYPIAEDTTFYPVFTEKTLPVITMFENPVSTTFGTKKNLLPDGFNATVSGLTGYTLILKVDGIPYGQTAKWGGIRPIVHAADGTNKDPVWNGNWVADLYKTNSYVFEENGYYLYYFPFKNVVNELGSEKTVAGVSRLNSLTVFDKSGALGWNGAEVTTTDENITVTLVGMVEGNIAPFDVVAKKDDVVLATKKTTASINMLNSVNNAGWAKLDTGFDLFGDQIGVEGTQYVKSWTNDDGVANDYILTEQVVRPVYGNSVLLTVTPAGNTAYGIKDYAVDVALGADTVDSAEIILEYNKNVFTNPHLADGTVLEDCPQGAILTLTGVNTAKVLFDISQNAVSGTYSFNADGTCDSAPAKTTGAVSIALNGQQVGGYFTEGENRVPIYKTNENNAAVDEEGKEVDEQKVWTGNVDFGGGKDTVTFVFKVDGVQSDINATRIHFNTNNGGQWKTSDWSQWRENWGRDADKTNGFASALTFKASDGATYYYLTLGRRYINNDGTTKFNSMQGFTLFKKDPSKKTTKLSWVNGDYSETQAAFNENEDAGFEMLAVVGGNLAPQVEFYNDTAENDGALIGTPYTYEYPKAEGYKDGTGSNTAMKKYGTLATVAEVFAASGYQTPVKASTDDAAYEFIGWVDENGKDITNAPVYKAQRIYANFKEIEAVKSTVTFMNDGVEYGKCEGILLNAYATAPEGTPTRADIPTGQYIFKGWSLEIDGEVIDLAIYPITEDLTLYASYEYQDVTFTVTYKDGETVVGTETVVRSMAVTQAPAMKRKFDSYSYNDDDWHNLAKQIENNLGKQYYDFFEWTNEDGSAVDLTNVQSNLTVSAKYEAKPIENWYKVEWRVQKGVNEARITAQWIAEGDSTYTLPGWVFANDMQPLHNTADEQYWYVRNGWDQDTTCVTGNMIVYPHYDTTPINTDSIIDEELTVSGAVTEKLVLFGGDRGSYVVPARKFGLLIKVEGASEENPVTLGGMRTSIRGGSNTIDSNNSGNYSQTAPLLNAVTKDGYYYVNIWDSLLTWCGVEEIKSLAISDPNSTRGGKSIDASGEAKVTVTFLPAYFSAEVRFYDEDGKFLATRKYSTGDKYSGVALPTLTELYKNALPDNFLRWEDADGNEVTQVYDNMDVYMVCEQPGTVKVDAENFVGLKAGTTVEIPVIASGMTFNAITFDVTVSENVTLADVVAAEGFDVAAAEVSGYTATYVAAATENLVVGKDESQVIAYVKLTVASDLTVGDAVSIDVDVTQALNAEGKVKCDGASTTLYTTTYYGDVNGDGVVDGTDSTLLMKYTAGWAPSTYADIYDVTFGDVNGDGVVDGTDSTLLMKHTAGWAPTAYADAVKLKTLIP